jgi:hypothetical protein
MPYSHTSWISLQGALSTRLGDVNQIFWVATEIRLYLEESLRTFGLLSGFWRARGTLHSTANTAFYDINVLLSDGVGQILSTTVTDRDIIEQIQYALLEPATTQSSWPGTEMFTFADVAGAVQNRLNQFMSDTGIVVNRSVIAAAAPPISREDLSGSTVDVRRAAWLGASPENYYRTMWREDERLLTAYDPSWNITPGIPSSYSVMGPPPLVIQIAPPPLTNGQIELLTVDSKDLAPASSATVLGIPDDLSPAVKWGALADLLGIDGIARDPVRAQFCEQRYQQYVQLAKLLPVALHAEINGVPLIPSTLQEMDASNPNWQNVASNSRNPVQDLVLAAPNLIGLSAVPSTATSVTLDVVRKTPIPALALDPVQIGREQLDMVLDYAENLAMFKVGGAEWHSTERQANNFLLQSVTFNQRMSASARAAASAAFQSEREESGIPRAGKSGFGVGALKVANGGA